MYYVGSIQCTREDLPCRPSQAIANLVLHAPIAIYSRSNAIQLEITRRKNYGREAERQ